MGPQLGGKRVSDRTPSHPHGGGVRGKAPVGGDERNAGYLTDTREALRTLIADIKAGKADHLL